MTQVNMHEAKSRLSQLAEAVESGREPEIIIARNGKPAVRLVPLETKRQRYRFGLAAGKYVIPDDIDRDNAEIEHLFYGDDD